MTYNNLFLIQIVIDDILGIDKEVKNNNNNFISCYETIIAI